MKRRLRMLRSNNGVVPVYGQTANWVSSPERLLPPGFSLTRASTGTYFDSAGLLQTAAIDAARGTYRYNGSSWVFDGTIVEAAATNLLPYSNVFSSWGDAGTTGAVQDVIGLDGATSAWTLTRSAGVNEYKYAFPTLTVGTTYCISGYVEKSESFSVGPVIGFYNQGYEYWGINNQTGAATKVYDDRAGGNSTCTVTQETATRWRVSIVFTMLVASDFQIILIPNIFNGTAVDYALSGSSVYERFQIEVGSAPTSYIPNNGSGTTARAADVLTAPTSGLLVNGQGFAAIGARVIAYGGAGPNVAIGSPTGGLAAPLYFTSSSGQLTSYDGTNVCSYGASTAAPAVGAAFKAATTWGGITFGGALNGVVGTPSTAFDGNINFDSSIQIGNGIANTVPLSMVLQSLRLGIRAAANVELGSWTV